ncbi:hypothetical protein QZH41_019473, partial [Actinostola sp. cb2023]
CEHPLGMEDGTIKDSQISASAYYRSSESNRQAPWNGRLNKKKDAKGIGGWAAGSPGKGAYIQIDLRSVKVVTKVATQGREDCCAQYVTNYSLSYSNDGDNWSDYEGDCVKVFPGNAGQQSIVTNKLEVPIKARYIRLIVKKYSGGPTMRMELYGCCEHPLGMEDGTIKDSVISASSYASNNPVHKPENGRLNKKKDAKGIGGWAAGSKGKGEHIQIDLGSVKVVTKVATQGRQDHFEQYVTKYSLSYSNDGENWSDYEGDCVKVFPGNADQQSIVTNKLEVPIKARYIRLIVKGYVNHATMRMELYGCSELPAG